MVTFLVLSCALTLGQTGDRAEWQLAPQLAPGLELVYQGTYLEESLIPNVQHQRRYKLETTLLVLDAKTRHWDVAVMTALGLQDGQPEKPGRAAPQSVRLEVLQIDQQGKATGPDRKTLSLPVMGPPQLEFGFLVEAPVSRVTRGSSWEVAEPGRPPRSWQVIGPEAVNGITCVKVVGQQQSTDWDNPHDGQVGWRRTDTVWLSPQLLVAQKVERVVERKAPARLTPTERATVRYELQSPLRYPGRIFAERRQEIAKARKFADEAQALVKQPAQHRLEIETLLRKIGYHLEQSPPTPYRKAVLTVRATLEAARRGEGPVHVEPEEPIVPVKAVGLGQRVPDFVVSSLTEKESARLHRHLGKPILVLFYNPAAPSGPEVLQFAKRLAEQHANGLTILALAVTADPDAARKQHADLRLPFPIHDGHGMRITFGVENTPRFVLLDGEGMVRCATTGWGYGTPAEIVEALGQCKSR